jgi:hypothetical protein
MLVLAVLGAALIVSLMTGGRLRYAANWHLKGLWLALAVCVIQIALFTQWAEDLIGEDAVPVVYVVTLAVLLVFLFLNRRTFGVPILMTGLILNVLVIAANGGRMPASATALIRAGRGGEAERLLSRTAAANCVLMSGSTKLNALGDIIVIRLSRRVGSAYSVGDLVALAGEAVVAFGAVRATSSTLQKDPEHPGVRL